jgi:hypothetical protein
MRVLRRDGKEYRLPGKLNPFQEEMYIHLIDRKWQMEIYKPGYFKYKGNLILYDAILPKKLRNKFTLIYPGIKERFKEHLRKHFFKIHKFFNHMASSQAANANLFLPILISPKVNSIFNALKPDFARIATKELDQGFRIEYWDDKHYCLNDHSKAAGTDSDIAIAYYNKNDELCLWLIEHKLTEREFTTCGGSKSDKRTKRHNCNKTIDEILADKDACYYHSAKGFKYWDIMSRHRQFFKNDSAYMGCPFRRGENQLWRNILMALALEDQGAYDHVYFSVVKHPDNIYLDRTIERFRNLIDDNPMFSVFTSKKVLKAVEEAQNKGDRDIALDEWKAWYEDFYRIK